MLCAMMGLKAVVITNHKCSREKQDSIRAYGAQLIIAEAGADTVLSYVIVAILLVASHAVRLWQRRLYYCM